MQKNHALRVALKDRPKAFQVTVLFLFSLAVLIVIVAAVSSWQKFQQPSSSTRQGKAIFAGTANASQAVAKQE